MLTRFLFLTVALWVAIFAGFVAVITHDGLPFVFACMLVLALVVDMRRKWDKDRGADV